MCACAPSDAHKVAKAFHKYDGTSPNPWTQSGTCDTPDLSGTAGKYAALWTDEPVGEVSVIYDKSFDVYLPSTAAMGVSKYEPRDIIHWSGPIGDPYHETGRTLFYLSLVCSCGGYFLWNLALSRMEAVKVAVWQYLDPPVAFMGESLVFNIVPSSAVLIAATAIIIGALLTNRSKRSQTRLASG